MKTVLPRRIAYLAPFIDQLEAMEPDEVDESTDTSLLHCLLAERISGVEIDEAAERLETDREVLADWLDERGDHPAQFLFAYLESAEELAKHLKANPPAPYERVPNKQPPRGKKVTISPPPGFTMRTIKGMLVMLNEDALARVPGPGACAVTIESLTRDGAEQRFGDVLMASEATAPQPARVEGVSGLRAKHADTYFYKIAMDSAYLIIAVQGAEGRQLAEIEAAFRTIRAQ